MKKYILTIAFVLFSVSVCQAGGCSEKIKSIETEIEIAKKHDNTSKVRGLERALSSAKQNCNDESLAEKKANKIKDKQLDVIKAQKEVDEAIAQDKPQNKINKKIFKLNEQKQELQDELEN